MHGGDKMVNNYLKLMSDSRNEAFLVFFNDELRGDIDEAIAAIEDERKFCEEKKWSASTSSSRRASGTRPSR